MFYPAGGYAGLYFETFGAVVTPPPPVESGGSIGRRGELPPPRPIPAIHARLQLELLPFEFRARAQAIPAEIRAELQLDMQTLGISGAVEFADVQAQLLMTLEALDVTGSLTAKRKS